MVIDRGAFLSGRYAKVYDEIVQVKEACGDAHLKVILETGELGTYDNVRRASLLAMAAGADFIKTSTGKIQPAATLPVTLVMLEAIRDVHDETGRVVGMKPAGRDPAREAGDPVPRAPARDARPGLAHARPLPVRRLLAPERRAHADPQAEDRAPTSRRTTSRSTDLERSRSGHAPAPLEWDYAPAPEARGHRHDPRPLRAVRRRRVARAALRRVVHDHLARGRGAARRGRAGRGRGRRRSRSRPRARRSRTAGRRLRPVRARQVPLPDRAHPPGALARVRGARVAERRQADQGVARRRPAARRGALLLLRRLGRQARVRVPEPAAAPARRRGPDHPVELPAADAGLEGRAGTRRGEHRRAQAGRDDAADGAPVLRRPAPGRAAAGRRQHRHRRRPRPAPSSSSTRASTRSRSRARPRSARRSSASSPERASG